MAQAASIAPRRVNRRSVFTGIARRPGGTSTGGSGNRAAATTSAEQALDGRMIIFA
jgi:hypothetical protein